MDNQRLVDNWLDDAVDAQAAIRLTAGERYNLRLETRNTDVHIGCHLKWSIHGQEKVGIRAEAIKPWRFASSQGPRPDPANDNPVGIVFDDRVDARSAY